MNLKRTLISAVAGLALVASIAVPAQIATAEGEESNVTVNEGGSFSNLHMWYGGVTFGPVTVTSQNAATVSQPNQYIDLTDTRASSPGWTIQLEATNLSADDTHTIESKNLSLAFSHWGPQCADPAVWDSSNPGNPSNDFQTVSNLVVGTQTLASPINVMEADAGRGCNRLAGLYDFTLYVPAGTFTSGQSAVYTGDLILTHTDKSP